jgi:hypothetical protein
MKHLFVFVAVAALGATVVVACSDEAGTPGATPSPDGTNDGGSSGSPIADGGTGADTSTAPPEPTYETWRLVRNPTAKEDSVATIAANAEQVFISGTEDGKSFVESRRIGSGTVVWRVDVTSVAALAANAAFVATGVDSTLTLRSVADGKVVWTKSADSPIGHLVIADTRVIAGGTSFAPYPSDASSWSVQSYDLATGNAAWASPVGAASSYGDYLGGLAVTSDALYLSYTVSGGPYTKNWYVKKQPIVSGQPQSTGGWTKPQTGGSYNGASGIVADAQRVYATGIVSDVRQVVALNAADGAELWRKPPPSTLPFTAGLLFGGTPFLDASGVMIFGAQQYSQKRSATYLLAAADGADSRIVEHFAGATVAAISGGHLFVAGTTSLTDAGDGQFSATSHIELK